MTPCLTMVEPMNWLKISHGSQWRVTLRYAENIRNSVNIFNQGFAELSFKKTPELLDGFRKVIAKQGIDLRGLSEEAAETAMRAGEYDDLANQLADPDRRRDKCNRCSSAWRISWIYSGCEQKHRSSNYWCIWKQ